ncbi:MAG: hypothetical protein WA208_21075 [Thermoanaerobaculia bacterium]
MKNAIAGALALMAAMLLNGCATVVRDDDTARTVVGTEEGIRIEGEIFGEAMTPGGRVPITWTIRNQRTVAIAVADIVAESSYDPETRTITVGLGAEVPGEQLLPRLVSVAPGESKSFSTAAAVGFISSGSPQPNALRLRVNFLADVKPFARLIGIQEKAVADAAFAAEIFPLWLERTEAVYTSAVPMRWGPAVVDPISAARRR